MKELLAESIQPVKQAIYRIVESQEKSATMRLVNSFEEQDLLEQLIEESKPQNDTQERHYLIATPFRYPPLKYGSRFGGQYEPSLLYGSHSIHTMLHESAYYTFYFMDAMAMPFQGVAINHKTSFQMSVVSENYIDLSLINEAGWQDQLVSKQDYSFSQQVGDQMRLLGVEAFSYTSARDPFVGLNMGVFSIDAIPNGPANLMQWEIKQTPIEIMFSCTTDKKHNQVIGRERFLIDGKIPAPSH